MQEFNVDWGLLLQGLIWLIQGGGAGVVIYYVIEKWLKPTAWFQKLTSEQVRWVGIGASALLGIACYGFGIWMRYFVTPIDVREWVNHLIAVGFTSAVASQLWHGAKKLRS